MLQAVRGFKYGGNLALRRDLEGLLVDAWRRFYAEQRKGGRRKRCAACPATPARALAATLGPPWQPEALVKVRKTPDLVGLGAEERLAVVRGAFAWRQRSAGTVVLVDEVVTTTASARVCAPACRGAGADQVQVLALARTSLQGTSGQG